MDKYDIESCFPFDDYRPHQKETIFKIIEAFERGKKYVVLESPTGIGKSVIAYTVGKYIMGLTNPDMITAHKKLYGPPAIVCTKTRQLQRQYRSSFNDLKHLWSSRHYMCDIEPNYPEDFYYGAPLCMNALCSEIGSCKFLKAKQRFNFSGIGILNYHYYLYSICSKKFKPKLLVLDEAHNIESILCDMFTINMSASMIYNIFDKSRRYRLTDITDERLKALISNILNVEDIEDGEFNIDLKRCCDHLTYIKDGATKEIERIKKIGVDKIPESYKEFAIDLSKLNTRCEELIEKLYRFIYRKTSWVVSYRDKAKLKIKPLEIGYLSDMLLTSASKLLFMSATICGFEQFCKELNIDTSQSEFIDTPSIIPAKNRKVLSFNTGKINYKNKNDVMPKIIETMDVMVDKITESKGSVRGIVHSISYDNAKMIYDSSKHRVRMVLPNKTEVININSLLEIYDNTIVVSPSILEGVDLKDDLSRFQIFPKIPYPFLGDMWIKAKMEKDRKWYARQAIMKTIQGSGRSTRTENDWSITLIFDLGFRVLLDNHPEMFPKWYKEAIEYINVKT